MRKYTPEMKAYLKEIIPGHTSEEISNLFTSKFGIVMTPGQVKSYKTNYKIRSGTPVGKPKGQGGSVFPKEVADYIRENYKGTGHKEMAAQLKDLFDRDYTQEQIKGFYGNNKLDSGLDGKFKKGRTSHNKGKKGYYSPGSEKGWFKKGHTPINHKPVGSERIDVDGYTYIKTSEPNIWELKHKLIWEAENGPTPEGYNIMFKDTDQQNLSLDNLVLVSDYELLILNRKKLISSNPELTETGINISKIFAKINDRRKEFKK